MALLPERHTDMIFAVIGEELGILGMLFVLLSFAYILTKGFQYCETSIKKRQKIQFLCCFWYLYMVCNANYSQYWHELRTFTT